MSFTRRPGSGRPGHTKRREDRHIVRNARVQPTASSVDIQAQVVPSLGAPVSSGTIRRRLAEGQCSVSHGTARVSQDYLRTVTTLPWLARSLDLSPIEHTWDHLGRRVWHPTSLNELEARLQQNGIKYLKTPYRTCMPQCPIVSHRSFALEGVQQRIKSSVLLPFSLK
ncbi:transposable element Tcb1 transposase [Trichonephila clavipes]|nr:transposable element Tcb1 transposase [Trichonephila clavipes]